MKRRTIKEVKKSFAEALKENIKMLPMDADNKRMCWDICFTTFIAEIPEDDIFKARKDYVEKVKKLIKLT